MKINWKVRLKNPIFWGHVFGAVLLPILSYFGLTGTDVTSWTILFDTLMQAILNPYVVFTVVISVWGIITDPTTKGIADSKQALSYNKPKENN